MEKKIEKEKEMIIKFLECYQKYPTLEMKLTLKDGETRILDKRYILKNDHLIFMNQPMSKKILIGDIQKADVYSV